MARREVFTRQTVHDILQSHWESDLPDRTLQALRAFDGKPITTRLLAKLPTLANGATWRLIRHYGWTSLETSTYGQPQGYRDKTSMSLVLVRTEASVPLDTAWVERENTAYFAARRERNHARMEAMNTKTTLDACAAAMSGCSAALTALQTAMAQLETLTEVGTNLNPDRYTLQKACGVYGVELDGA